VRRAHGVTHQDGSAAETEFAEVHVVAHDVDAVDVSECVLFGHAVDEDLHPLHRDEELAVTACWIEHGLAGAKVALGHLLEHLHDEYRRREHLSGCSDTFHSALDTTHVVM
jgi:hypothetical protein